MLDVIAHRGAWNANMPQNSTDAVLHALNIGCSVEIDLRLNAEKSEVVVSHDHLPDYPLTLSDLLDQIKGRRCTLFLHIKADYEDVLFALFDVKHRLTKFNLVFFGITNHPIMQEYGRTFGWDSIAYEIEKGNFGSVQGALQSNAENIWLAEMSEEFTDSEYEQLKSAGKKLYQVAPDVTCFPKPHDVNGFLKKIKHLDGVCSDVTGFYLDFKHRKPLN